MLCLVCGKELGDKNLGTMCPLCGFPIIEIFGDNRDEEIKKLENEISAHRDDFFSKVTVGVMTYHWSADGGQMKKDSEKEIPFGRLNELYNRTSWLNEKFDSPSERKSVDVTVMIKSPSGVSERTVQVPNSKTDRA